MTLAFRKWMAKHARVFGEFLKYENPDETGPEPFFHSMEVYYSEE